MLHTNNYLTRTIKGCLLVIIVASIAFSACNQEEILILEPGNIQTPLDTSSIATDAISYLALGDSYTIGEAVPPAEIFPRQLVSRLSEDNFPVRMVTVIARTGWTTDELLNEINKANLSDTTYNLISLLIGVNNQYRGRTLENYQEEFTTLLLRAIELAGNRPERVIVLSIPDYGITPFIQSSTEAEKIAVEIDAFNDAAAQISLIHDVLFLDITTISREAAADRSLIAPDGLHPSGKMYARWVALMLPEVKTMVE